MAPKLAILAIFSSKGGVQLLSLKAGGGGGQIFILLRIFMKIGTQPRQGV